MRISITTVAAALLVAGCSNETPVQNEVEEAAKPAAGQYQADWKVTSLRSVDKTVPATKLKQDATGTLSACVAADGTIDAAIFAEAGDSCTVANPYVRNGRIGMDLTCKRTGQGGEVRQSVSGTFNSDRIDAEVSTTTYMTGSGDYSMTRTVKATRIGECPPATETTEKNT